MLALLALIILAWCCIYKHHPDDIQQDITERTQQALDKVNADNFSLRVDGRDVYLSTKQVAGQFSQAEKESIVDLVSNIWGVRAVVFEGDVAAAGKMTEIPNDVTPVPDLPSLLADYNGNTVVLNGVLASEADIALLVSDVKTIFGPDIQVVNNLTKGSSASSLSAVKAGLLKLSSLSAGQLLLEQQTLRLRGEVATPTLQQATETEFKQLASNYPDFDFVAGLNVASSYDSQACQKRLNELIANNNVRFQSGKADIRNDSLPLLNRISLVSQRCEANIHIKGHTDSSGKAAFNLYLSQQRAASVKQYLVSKGVAASRIQATGMGETQPIAENATATGRALNRRIEFNVE